MADIGDDAARPAQAALGFLAGALTSAVIFLMILAFLGHRIGFATIARRLGINSTSLVLDIPERVIEELRALDGIVANASNPTHAREHDTFVVRPDPELGYVLRPGTHVLAHVVRARGPINLDHPIVYTGADREIPAELRSYLDERTQLEFSYTVDEAGFRRTVPAVQSERKILMVGDSALFGSGVNDDQTIASHLQGLVGDSYQVINAGVGGYTGFQAFKVARKMAEEDRYDFLVYAAHHNDFFKSRRIASSELAEDVLGRFATLKGEFPKGVIVSLVTYLNYAARETLLEQGWGRDRIDATDELRQDLPRIAAAAGFEFIDFTDAVEELVRRDGTVFAPFAIYCDRAHLSPRGNRLLAERIFEALREMTERSS